jgi:molybdopterin-biosynthesis enzyme MoeA-like protein
MANQLHYAVSDEIHRCLESGGEQQVRVRQNARVIEICAATSAFGFSVQEDAAQQVVPRIPSQFAKMTEEPGIQSSCRRLSALECRVSYPYIG